MKTNSQGLALFGGTPAFQQTLHVGRPNVGNREHLLARINSILDSRWLTNDGPQVAEFEARIADFTGVKHCIAMCNATVALEVAIRALNLTGEVIVPSFTFIATAHALQWQGITPIFCDVDAQRHLIDPLRVEQLITPRTSGILGVHLWGHACDSGAIAEIALRHNLKIIYDAAHAFGSSHNGKMIGNFGNAEVFSFHATKFFNSFEGGAVVTNDDQLAARIRLMKNFGFSDYDQVSLIGTNGKMSEVSAAMGLTSLESIDDFITVNRNHYQQYIEELRDLRGVRTMIYDATEKMNYQYVVVEIDPGVAKLTRDELLQVLWAENVIARRYFYPGCHRMEPYRSYYPHAGLVLPVTEHLVQRVMLLPTGTAVLPEDISKICQIIKTAISEAKEVHKYLSSQSSEFKLRATAEPTRV
jgi:dTDP-4-amino-4,6-dideoxygalactose transaminase